ncbi:hypothetical protein EKL33_09130, partial [Pseudomonas aeruginosa]
MHYLHFSKKHPSLPQRKRDGLADSCPDAVGRRSRAWIRIGAPRAHPPAAPTGADNAGGGRGGGNPFGLPGGGGGGEKK